MPPTLYLIDGHALVYRTYFALSATPTGNLKTSKGEPTSGIFGFANVLLSLLEKENPQYLAIAFDTGKTFRDDLFPEYKATREKMPEDLRPQLKRIREMVDAFNIPRLEIEGFEADDVLGSITSQAVKDGFGVKIITGDRDLLQLAGERIIINLPGSKLSESRDYHYEDVKEYIGVNPEQIIDYKGLAGDTSDNIPGVSGIGHKTAVGLLDTYSNLEDIYNHLDELPARIRNKLEVSRDIAQLSKTLATIRQDVPISLNLEKANTIHINLKDGLALFKELEFRSLIPRINKLADKPRTLIQESQPTLFKDDITITAAQSGYQPRYEIIDNLESLRELTGKLQNARVISIDTETTSTDPMIARLVGISIALAENDAFYIPTGHLTGESQIDLSVVLDALKPSFMDQNKLRIGHNQKYDGLVLKQHGLDMRTYSFDTMIAQWLIDPASRHFGLKDMASSYLNIQMTEIEELIGKGKSQISMAQVPVTIAAPYAAADAEVTLRLMPLLKSGLEKVNAIRLLNEIEMPLIPILIDMEQKGIAINAPLLGEMSRSLSERMFEIENEVYSVVGYRFNINSTQQLSKALFETLKLEPPDRRNRTSSGHFSTSASILEDIKFQHEVVNLLLEYRELAKLQSTYLESLPRQINPTTGRIHTSFNQTGSVTGRLASSDPNLQNIPTRTELGKKVRQGFVSGEGQVFLSIDYSQIELRIVAHMSGDDAMLEAFRTGQDIHAATASAIFNIPIENITKEQRRHAKAINFGLIYGMSAFGLSRTTGLTIAESEDFVKAYFQQFPKVKSFLDQLRITAGQQGYVETLLGRRRYFPNLQKQAPNQIRQREEREAINAPIQGTAADILKIAMIRVPAALAEHGLNADLLLQVHDELLFEVPEHEIQQTVRIMQSVMEKAYPLCIPLTTETSFGKDWGNLKPMKPEEGNQIS